MRAPEDDCRRIGDDDRAARARRRGGAPSPDRADSALADVGRSVAQTRKPVQGRKVRVRQARQVRRARLGAPADALALAPRRVHGVGTLADHAAHHQQGLLGHLVQVDLELGRAPAGERRHVGADVVHDPRPDVLGRVADVGDELALLVRVHPLFRTDAYFFRASVPQRDAGGFSLLERTMHA